jgi:hypothetical protein
MSSMIAALHSKGSLTEAMREWAHAIRLHGNDGAHEEIDQQTAQDLADFTELFLTYCYTLPGTLTERRARKTAAKGG